MIKDGIVLTLAIAALGGCKAGAPAPIQRSSAAANAAPSERDYQAAPTLTEAVLTAGGRVRLSGRATPGDQVRLASPEGRAVFGRVARDGIWRVELPTAPEPRLLGLAALHGERAVQSEGYLAVLPDGGAAQLRAGAGAQAVLSAAASGTVILAMDFDAKGGAVVSGRAAPRAVVDLWVDGARAGRGASGPDGLFSIALDQPLSFAGHKVQVVDGSGHAEASAELAMAPPLVHGPYRALRTPSGWRIDWTTPGGGLQSTLLMSPETRS